MAPAVHSLLLSLAQAALGPELHFAKVLGIGVSLNAPQRRLALIQDRSRQKEPTVAEIRLKPLHALFLAVAALTRPVQLSDRKHRITLALPLLKPHLLSKVLIVTLSAKPLVANLDMLHSRHRRPAMIQRPHHLPALRQ